MQSNVHRHQSLGQVLMYNVRNGGVISLWAGNPRTSPASSPLKTPV